MTEPTYVNTKRRISVIVPHYNDLARLDRCLASLTDQTIPADAFEIIVADNNSPCGIARVAELVGNRARLIVCTVPGAGPARNTGVKHANGEFLAFVDADCIASPLWLEQGIAALTDPQNRSEIIGGQVDVSVRGNGWRSGPEAFEQVFAFDNRRYVEQEQFSVTANLFTTRHVFQSVGPFRTEVSEDTEWCHRAVAAGYTLRFCPTAAVSHPAREDWAQLRGKWRRINREAYALACERPRGRLRWIVRSMALPVSIVAHSPRVFFSRKLASVRDRLAAFVTLVRIRLWRFADALRLALAPPASASRKRSAG